ncbi:MAG: hypothetical protein U0L48_05460, partial [Acutalibacteraceae bacterium]|nr:hypothetical protein [Acutalibacteraceae bacterium]
MPKAPVSQGRINRLNMRLLSLLLIAALMLSVLIAVPVLNSSAEQDMATKSAEWVDKENGIAKITLGVNDPTTSGSGSTTATTKPTEATTTTTTSSSTVDSKLLIDWDKQKNYYAINGTSTINSTDDNGINLTVRNAGRILGTYNNDTTGYDGITFTAKGNGSLRAVVVSVEISVETSYTAVSESGTTFILDFANLGITPSEKTEINFEVEDACELTISDIYLYSNTDNVAVAAVALSDDTSTAIVTYDFDNKIPTYSTIGSSVDSSSVYSATVVQYNSSNALKVNSNYWDGEYSDAFKAQDEYVKIDITETGIKSILFDAITVVDWYKYNGHYGVMIDGTIYWDNQYDNGLITREANSTYTIESGTKLYSFTGSFSSAQSVVEKTLTETDISNI